MDKDELVDVTVSPSVDTTSTTTTDTNTAAPVVNEQHADDKPIVEAKDTDLVEVIDGEEPKTEDKPVDNSITERERIKMSKLEKERNEFAKRTEEVEVANYRRTLKLIQNEGTRTDINNEFISDPKAYEDFRKIHNKMNPNDQLPDYKAVYGNTQIENRPNSQNQSYVDTEALKQQIKREVKQEEAADIAVQEFLRAVPEMDPKNAKPEDTERLQYMGALMDNLVSHVKLLHPEMSLSQAYIEAWNSLPENRDKQVQLAQEIGELKGMAKNLNSASSTSSSTSGSLGAAVQSTSFKLTKAEREHFEELKRVDEKAALKYAQYAHKQHIG